MVKCDKSHRPQCRKILSLSSHVEVKWCEKQEEERSVRSGENEPTGPSAEQARGGAAQDGRQPEKGLFCVDPDASSDVGFSSPRQTEHRY